MVYLPNSMLNTTNFKYYVTTRLEVKRWRKRYHDKNKHKKPGETVIMSK